MKKLTHNYLFLFIIFFFAQSSIVLAADITNLKHEELNLDGIFKEIKGTAVFYTPRTNSLKIYNKNMVDAQAPPQSTFKIISTLMGLEYGIIIDKNSKMRYNGTKYWLDAWNKDVNLAEAFQFSCVWYYHQLVYSLKKVQVSDFLDKLHYGNKNISQWQGNGSNKLKELNGFWLSSSLKISPREQVQTLANIFEGKTFIKNKNIAILQDIMLQEHRAQGDRIYAKTGSNIKGKSWYVGFIKAKSGNTYFAFYVDDAKGGVSGAKEIALQVLDKETPFWH